MALIMGITLPAGFEIIYNKTIRMYDISVFCNVGKNPRFYPRNKYKTLQEITYLFQIAYAWSLFSDEVKANWKAAADIIGEHSYNLYVQDKSYRIKYGIGGNADPSVYHQYTVGHLSVQNPATGALIAQYNPHKIYFPANFQINYKADLTANGVNPYARLKFIWTRYISGQNIEETETIELNLSQAWTLETKDITTQSGIKGRWRIELELNDVTGDIWFDNLWVYYRGEIKINDPYCMDVVKWWKNVNPGEGISLETIYPTGGAL